MVEKSSDYLLSIDIGTTGGRTIIFDNSGKIISSAYEEYSCFYPSPSCVEQNAEDWWRVASNTIHNAIKNSKINPSKIVGISCTNQRETIVAVNREGKPLSNAIVWQDRRSIKECQEIAKVIGREKIYEITGLTIDPYFSSSKILWLKKNMPKVFKSAYKFLLVHDFIQMKLTGKFVTDYSNASRTMLFDINNHKWSDEILSALEIQEEKLPEPMPSGIQIGSLLKSTAEAIGLSLEIPVITGGGDQQCAAIGVGVTQKGRVKATTGTGTFLLAFLEKSQRDSKKRVICSCHAIPNKYVFEASIFTTGSILRWFRDNFSSAEKSLATCLSMDSYDLLSMQAKTIPPGSEGVFVLPHFIGAGAPHWNPNARGLIFGLSLGHTRNHIIKAIMEATCYEIRTNLEIFNELNVTLKELRITGGASRNALWNQIEADICKLIVLKGKVEEATALGAAILAAVGVKLYKNIEEATEQMVTIDMQKTPNKENSLIYDKYFSIYKQLYSTLNESHLFEQLANI